jgi:hypothetical protein
MATTSKVIRRKRPMKAVEMAEKFGISVRTVKRVFAQPRAEYEAQSISRTKPWEALGMSRATWYRKGKPAAPPEASGAGAARRTG